MHTFICIHTEYLRACLYVKNVRLSTLPGHLPHEPLSLSYLYVYIYILSNRRKERSKRKSPTTPLLVEVP